MTLKEHFGRARAAERWGEWIFRAVFSLSLAALFVPDGWITNFIDPLLITACVVGVAVSFLTTTWQNGGNQLLRASQLTNSFEVPVGEAARKDYYNNRFPPSVDRLAATTFENSLFTSRVLEIMLQKERLFIAGYVVVFILLMASRWSSTNSLLLLAQTVFSVDIALHWFRMERFRWRACRVQRELHQFFFQGGTAADAKGLAIALGCFSDYECAKDEAAMPLERKVFETINPAVSKEWEQLRQDLKIP